MIPKGGQSIAFEFEITLRVSTGGDDAGVPKVIADDRKIDTGLKKRAGAAMAEHVWSDPFGERLVFAGCFTSMLGKNILRAMPGERRPPDAAEGRICRVWLFTGEDRF